MSKSELLLQVLTMAGSEEWGEENELDRSTLFGIAEEKVTRDIHDSLKTLDRNYGFHDKCKLSHERFMKAFDHITSSTRKREGEFLHAN